MMDASGDSGIDSSDDTAVVKTDTSNAGQGLSEREIMKRRQAAP